MRCDPVAGDVPALLARRKDANSRLLREDVAARRPVFRALPEVVGFYTSDVCNLRCGMCPRCLAQGEHKLPRDVLARVCTDLFPTARKAILTSAAGEPLLADFDLLLGEARRHAVRMDLSTSGTLLTPEVYRAARPVFDHLNVSLDCHVPEVYERIRAGARFERVHANLRGICEERRRRPDDVLFSLSFLVMASNLPHLADFVRFAHELGVDGVLCQRLRHEVKASEDEDPFLRQPGEVERVVEEARAVARELGFTLLLHELGMESVVGRPIRAKVPPSLEGQGLCWFTAQNMGVMSNGDVYPCCYPTDHRLGNVHEQRPAEIWNGPAARALRAAHFSRRGTLFCNGCIHAPHLRTCGPAAVVHSGRWLRRLVGHGASRLRDRRRERRPVPAPRSATRVFYVCNWTGESGGIKVLYDHVRLLRRLGFDARLGAYGDFQRCAWFVHDPAEIPGVSRFLDELLPGDLVVLPEFCMRDEELAGRPCRQVVLVQNPDLMTGPAADPRYEAFLTPSEALVPWIREERGFDGPLLVVPGFLEDELVLPQRRFPERRPRVLLIDRIDKNNGEPALARAALERRGLPVALVDERLPRAAFVELFRQHDVYLHLSYREGFPISVLEAFGAGCLVAGFAGRGGLEFMRDGHNCFVAGDGDWANLVERTFEVAAAPRARPDAMLVAARATALEFPEARARRRLQQVFAILLGPRMVPA